ncbi:MAG: hypothetical protein U0359_23945 [Byssovorax sp.]
MSSPAPADAGDTLSLPEIAAITAAIAEGDRPAEAVLAERGLTLARWRDISTRVAYLLAEDEAAADAYAEAYCRAQDALKPAPDLTPEQWAELGAEVAAEGAAALARRSLRQADWMRLSRRWAATLARDRALAARYEKRRFALEK